MVLIIGNLRPGMDDAFASFCIPKAIAMSMGELLKSKGTARMDIYLSSLYGISTRHVVEMAERCIRPYWFGDECRIGLDSSKVDPKSNQRVESLMKLVDSGNTDVKGLGILRESLEFIGRNLGSLYGIYLKGNSASRKDGR